MSFSTNFIPGKKMTPPIHLQEKKNEARGSELSLSCHFLKEPSSISGVFQKALILNEVQDSNTETFENSFTKKKKSGPGLWSQSQQNSYIAEFMGLCCNMLNKQVHKLKWDRLFPVSPNTVLISRHATKIFAGTIK